MGIGWNEETRKKHMASVDSYAECNFTLLFRFEATLQKFPRVFRDPKEPLQRLINYVDFAILHRSDVTYPPLEVPCTFDFLNYNFFCEQYLKVTHFFFFMINL